MLAALQLGSVLCAALSVPPLLQQLLLGNVAEQIALCTPVLAWNGSDTCLMVRCGDVWVLVAPWAAHGASWRAVDVVYFWCA